MNCAVQIFCTKVKTYAVQVNLAERCGSLVYTSLLTAKDIPGQVITICHMLS